MADGLRIPLATAVREAQLASEDERKAEQLSLLPGPAAAAERDLRRGPGRPKGAKDRRTTDMVRFIRANYRDPLVFLADAISRPVEQLAAELATDRDEAFKLQLAAARELAPYMHGKQQPVEGEVQAPVTFTIEATAEVAAMVNQAVGEDGVVTLPVCNDFNGLGDGDGAQSDSGESDNEG